MTGVDYDFASNLHTESGALKGMRYLIDDGRFASILDVGSGTGTWLAAALTLGIGDVLGVDGVPTEDRQLSVPRNLVRVADLRRPLDLGRSFGAVICLEVAEHLPQESASTLVESLCTHSDLVYFSAAAPHQLGYQHINCQWPSYWQSRFNSLGFACSDAIRFAMWADAGIEPWYRQNIFTARRDRVRAGREPRLLDIVHPEMIRYLKHPDSPYARELCRIEQGSLENKEYALLLANAIRRKVQRYLTRK